MWWPKSVNKIFPSKRNTNQNFCSPDEKNSGCQCFFKKQKDFSANELEYKHTYHSKNHEERIECRPNRGSFVRLPNVSSHFCTFSWLYLLEKKCSRLKNCRLVLCCLCSRYLKRSLLSRGRSERSEHHAARTRPQPCSISRSSPLNLC